MQFGLLKREYGKVGDPPKGKGKPKKAKSAMPKIPLPAAKGACG